MKSITIRNVPPSHLDQLKQVAKEQNTSVQKLLLSIVADYVGNPDAGNIVLGYVKIAYIGDVNMTDDCDVCGYPNLEHGIYAGIRGNGLNPVIACKSCAEGHA